MSNPATQSGLGDNLDSMIASRDSRAEDWYTLAFETTAGPQFR